MAGGAGAGASAGVIEEDAEVLGNVEEGHRLAVVVVGHGAVFELDCAAFGLKGDAHHVRAGRLAEVDYLLGVVSHLTLLILKSLNSAEKLLFNFCRGEW